MKISKLFPILLLFSPYSVEAEIVYNFYYTQPSGDVSPFETIDIYGTFELDPSSEPLELSRTNKPAASLLPATLTYNEFFSASLPYQQFNGLVFDINDLTYSYTSDFAFRTCSDTFTNACSPGEYTIEQGNSFIFSAADTGTTINPGDTHVFLLGTATPTNGNAAPGTYELFSFGFGLTHYFEASLYDEESEEFVNLTLSFEQSFSACEDNNSSCSFTRTVVPVPPALVFFATAMIGLAGARHKQMRSV
jgi:hypothetical protein